jgi:PAS domain S-box-containing protein
MQDGIMCSAEIHEDNLRGDFLVTCSPLRGPGGEIIGGVHVARDITERNRIEAELRQYRDHLEQLVAERTADLSREIADHKTTEKALRDSEARFRAIFEEAPIGIVLRDPTGRIVASNPALERILGYTIAELSGADRCFHFFDFSNHIAELHQELADGQRNFFVVEGRSFDKAGRPVWGRVHASRVRARDDQTWFTLSLIEDITREKETQTEIIAYQERLRALAAELTMTEERERRRLATDLHDNIGQVLALLQIRLGSLRQELPSPKMAADLDEARTLLSQIIASTRSLTLEMGLPVLHELGFASGVEWLGEKFHKQYGLKVEVNCEPLPAYIDSARETFLFRAVRELLTNVAKHARARRVSISTRAADREFILEVADDGIGFEVSRLSEVAGFGLFSIAERISNQGGNMEVTSAPGQGTMVTITFGQPQAPGDG